MSEKPRDPKSSLFDKKLIQEVLLAGLVIGLIVFAVWVYLIKCVDMPVESARGYVMALMVFMQNIHVFNCRSEKQSAFKVSIKSNPFVVISVICCIILQIIVMEVDVFAKFLQTTTVPVIHVLILFLVASIVLFAIEIYKEFVYNKSEK